MDLTVLHYNPITGSLTFCVIPDGDMATCEAMVGGGALQLGDALSLVVPDPSGAYKLVSDVWHGGAWAGIYTARTDDGELRSITKQEAECLAKHIRDHVSARAEKWGLK